MRPAPEREEDANGKADAEADHGEHDGDGQTSPLWRRDARQGSAAAHEPEEDDDRHDPRDHEAATPQEWEHRRDHEHQDDDGRQRWPPAFHGWIQPEEDEGQLVADERPAGPDAFDAAIASGA